MCLLWNVYRYQEMELPLPSAQKRNRLPETLGLSLAAVPSKQCKQPRTEPIPPRGPPQEGCSMGKKALQFNFGASGLTKSERDPSGVSDSWEITRGGISKTEEVYRTLLQRATGPPSSYPTPRLQALFLLPPLLSLHMVMHLERSPGGNES